MNIDLINSCPQEDAGLFTEDPPGLAQEVQVTKYSRPNINILFRVLRLELNTDGKPTCTIQISQALKHRNQRQYYFVITSESWTAVCTTSGKLISR